MQITFHQGSNLRQKAPLLSLKQKLDGLSKEEVEASRSRFGGNILTPRQRKSFWSQFVSNMKDPIIRILLGALVIKLFFALIGGGADWFETGGIAVAVLLATLISTLSEYGSESAFAKLSEVCGQSYCRVRRLDDNGIPVIHRIPIEEIVVGDILLLEAGELISADGRLWEGKLSVDQSAMTGEDRDIEKYPHDDSSLTPHNPAALFRGCTVLQGHGVMEVTAVGDATFLGHISEEVQADTRDSPLKRRLAQLAGQISYLGYVAAALVGIIYLINAIVFDSGFNSVLMLQKLADWKALCDILFSALTLALTVLVVAVPEGLPMMIAVVLSSNIKKMVRDQVLVRKPAGIEAAGSMNLLFTDKTGTLTEGKLSVGEIYLGTGNHFSSVEAFEQKAPGVWTHFHISCAYNTASSAGHMGDDPALIAVGGNATDRALLNFVLTRPMPAIESVENLLPFDSTHKYASAEIRAKGGTRHYVKGAPEKLLPYVRYTYNEQGIRVPLNTESIKEWLQKTTETGARVILIAVGEEKQSNEKVTQRSLGVLTLICLVVLRDALRAEAAISVKRLQGAGIHVVMMTGDNKETARHIAKSCGILHGKVQRVLDSSELSRMSDKDISEALPYIGVIARALPTDKSRLVRIAQESGLVVGMTGDGINDAPALRYADVGFAMGSGTQVAKDAGDIIILDNNLSSIVRAVLYGRTIFKSIRKFITLQLTMNFCAMAVTMICPFIGIDEPVTVVQMLWINLIMDTLGGLAFAGEAPLPSYLKEPPKGQNEPILNSYMKHQIFWLGSFTVGLCLLFLKWPFISTSFRPADDDIYLLTAFFAMFIFSSVFNCFGARTDRLNLLAGLSQNPGFYLIMSAVLGIQLIFVYVGGAILRTAPLTPEELWLTLALSLLVIPAEGLRKLIWRLKGKNERF